MFYSWREMYAPFPNSGRLSYRIRLSSPHPLVLGRRGEYADEVIAGARFQEHEYLIHWIEGSKFDRAHERGCLVLV